MLLTFTIIAAYTIGSDHVWANDVTTKASAPEGAANEIKTAAPPPLPTKKDLTPARMPILVDKQSSKIEFIGDTKLFDVRGHFKKWSVKGSIQEGRLQTLTLSASFMTSSLNTENKSRDEHLCKDDFFNCNAFPSAQFSLVSLVPTKVGGWNAKGNLTIRGKTHKVSFPLKIKKTRSGDKLNFQVQGEAQINRFDFDISYKAGLLKPSINKIVKIPLTFSFSTFAPKSRVSTAQ